MPPFTTHHDVYPFIDPQTRYDAQSYAGKVVFITGASRGIGQEIAIQYAMCGATLALNARSNMSLKEVKDSILAKAPVIQVGLFPGDVTDAVAVKAAIHGAIRVFGRIDILVANAGRSESTRATAIGTHDPEDWWKTVEVNLKGVHLLAHHSLPFIRQTEGHFLIVSALSAYWRMPCASAYTSSKLAVNCFAEFLALENPEIKVIAMNPGGVLTCMTKDKPTQVMEHIIDTPQLSACTILALTSGRFDWLSGRFVSATWDLSDVEKFREKILAENALVSSLRLV